MSLTNSLLLHALLMLLVVGSIAGLVVGVAMVLYPAWLMRVNRRANQWITTRQIDRVLEQAIKVDRWFYRHHRISGALLLGGAVFLIYFVIVRLNKAGILSGLAKAYAISPAISAVLLDTVVLSMVLGAAFAAIISLFLLVRPSMLRGFEQSANRWLSLRQVLKPLEVSRSGMDEYVFQNIQIAGVLLLLGSLYALAGVTLWLSRSGSV
ncbi:MAG: hypothetical protein V4443_03410 [Pseudomonadota bacterium]